MFLNQKKNNSNGQLALNDRMDRAKPTTLNPNIDGSPIIDFDVGANATVFKTKDNQFHVKKKKKKENKKRKPKFWLAKGLNSNN
jgi:hypothetical protein